MFCNQCGYDHPLNTEHRGMLGWWWRRLERFEREMLEWVEKSPILRAYREEEEPGGPHASTSAGEGSSSPTRPCAAEEAPRTAWDPGEPQEGAKPAGEREYDSASQGTTTKAEQ